MTFSHWQTPPQKLTLASGQLHVWKFYLDLSAAKIITLKELLSDDELQRAGRLLVLQKQQQFIVARAQLRKVLAGYLDSDPVALQFCYGEQGKPELCCDNPISFNLAHSGNCALIAVSKTGAVGIDVEKIDTGLDYQKLADRYFTQQELVVLNAESEQRRNVFFQLWTRKESLLKLTGRGFFAANAQQQDDQSIKYQPLPLMNNYIGAVAFSREVTSINYFQSPNN